MFDPTRGAHIKGMRLGEASVLAVTSFDQLQIITRHPADLQQGARLSQYDAEAIAEEIELHELVQRALTGRKKSNVASYARYIAEVVDGVRQGVLPPIHLWSREPLESVQSGANSFVVVPNGERLTAIDGETQLAGHYEVHRSASPESRRKHNKYELAVVIHHGITTTHARQLFHDLNVLAVRPNVSLSLSMNSSDPLTKVMDGLQRDVPALVNKVEHTRRQLSRTSPKIMTGNTLRQMVVDVAKGISGVQYGARPAPLGDLDMDELGDVAGLWIGRYLERFVREVLDREEFIAGSPAILAAVGAMGTALLAVPVEDRSSTADRLLRSLEAVDWRKGEQWVGIAGAMKKQGFSVNSPKEAAYNIYSALTDPANVNYTRIRTPRS